MCERIAMLAPTTTATHTVHIMADKWGPSEEKWFVPFAAKIDECEFDEHVCTPVDPYDWVHGHPGGATVVYHPSAWLDTSSQVWVCRVCSANTDSEDDVYVYRILS